MILKKSGRKVSIKSIFKNQTVNMCFFIVLLLFSAFFLIHLLFCYQIGFPASKTQVNSEHLTLSASDWLGFLGGYLGFAGSLLMSIVVYIQSRDVNKLTLAEYSPSINVDIIDDARSLMYDDNFDPDSVVQYYLKTKALYYAHICKPVDDNPKTEEESQQILLFVNIVNNSKSTIENLSFQSMEITELSKESRIYKFNNKGGNYDPADSKTMILPGRTLRRCFTISNFPRNIENMAWMQFRFTCSRGSLYSDMILFSKEGDKMKFLGACD